jgi:hypothetical protein
MGHTNESKALYRAEGVFSDALGTVLNERRALSLLFRALPPHIATNLTVETTTRPLGGKKWRRQASVQVAPSGSAHLELLVPAYSTTITHEVAHLLLDTARPGFADPELPDHGTLFRQTHLWVVRRTQSLKIARRLGEAYTNHGLDF